MSAFFCTETHEVSSLRSGAYAGFVHMNVRISTGPVCFRCFDDKQQAPMPSASKMIGNIRTYTRRPRHRATPLQTDKDRRERRGPLAMWHAFVYHIGKAKQSWGGWASAQFHYIETERNHFLWHVSLLLPLRTTIAFPLFATLTAAAPFFSHEPSADSRLYTALIFAAFFAVPWI